VPGDGSLTDAVDRKHWRHLISRRAPGADDVCSRIAFANGRRMKDMPANLPRGDLAPFLSWRLIVR
jgi:hypothetical protein